MSAFLTKLEVEQVDDLTQDGQGLWKLTAPLIYQSDLLAMKVIVDAGFVTDFASVPRIPIVFDMLGDRGNEAATIHDRLYSKPHICTRAQADAILREALKVQGVPAWMAALFYYGVRIGGASHWS